jgi:hypothetical protein
MAGKQQAFESVTLGHVRRNGCRDLLVYCGAIDCNHGSVMNTDHLPDDLLIRSLGPRTRPRVLFFRHVGARTFSTGSHVRAN